MDWGDQLCDWCVLECVTWSVTALFDRGKIKVGSDRLLGLRIVDRWYQNFSAQINPGMKIMTRFENLRGRNIREVFVFSQKKKKTKQTEVKIPSQKRVFRLSSGPLPDNIKAWIRSDLSDEVCDDSNKGWKATSSTCSFVHLMAQRNSATAWRLCGHADLLRRTAEHREL